MGGRTRIIEAPWQPRAVRDYGSHQQPIIVEDFVRQDEGEDEDDEDDEGDEDDKDDKDDEDDEDDEDDQENKGDKEDKDDRNRTRTTRVMRTARTMGMRRHTVCMQALLLVPPQHWQ